MWSEEKLNTLLTTPSDQLVEDVKKIKGDILVLGAAGKMGSTLCVLAKNAFLKAGMNNRVIGVARGSDKIAVKFMEDNGVEFIATDLLDKKLLYALPDAENVLFMAGKKFGTSGNEWQTWGMNSTLPNFVADKYKRSNIVVFSSGNVYPIVNLAECGCRECDKTGPIGEYTMSCLARERAFDYASNVYGTTIILTLMLGVAITLILLLCCPMLLKALGADGNVLRLAENYAFVIACGSLCQVFASSILVILRNDGKTYESMILSVLGLVLHIVLDILLAKRFKMYGVAAATVVSQLVVAFFGFCLAKIKKEVGMDYAKSFEILRAATAPFGLNFVPSFVLLFTNDFIYT